MAIRKERANFSTLASGGMSCENCLAGVVQAPQVPKNKSGLRPSEAAGTLCQSKEILASNFGLSREDAEGKCFIPPTSRCQLKLSCFEG
jgi:hypothetical protein